MPSSQNKVVLLEQYRSFPRDQHSPEIDQRPRNLGADTVMIATTSEYLWPTIAFGGSTFGGTVNTWTFPVMGAGMINPMEARVFVSPPDQSRDDPMADPSREEIDAKIAASEARTDTKIARLDGKLDLVLSKLDNVRDDNRTLRSNQWVIAFGLAVLIVGVVALFPVFFGIGTQIKDMIDSSVLSHIQVAPRPTK